MYTYISVDKLLKSPLNPRIVTDPEKLEALKNSIRLDGVKYPLVVRRVGDYFEVLDGSRRLEAARALGLEKLPCEIQNFENDLEAVKFTLRLHISQEDLKPEEIVNAIQLAIREGYYESEKAACQDLKISYRTYLEWKRQARKATEAEVAIEAAEIPDEAKKLIKSAKLSKEYAKQIVKHLEEDEDADVAELIEMYSRAEPRELEGGGLEARGKYLYRIRFSGRDAVFEIVRDSAVMASATFPREDLPIVKQLFKRAR